MNALRNNSFLDTNLAALAKMLDDGETSRFRNLTVPETLEIVETGSGHPTCRTNGVWVYSRHDPMKEARRLIESEVPKSTEICIFENFGLGYYVEVFLKAVPNGRAVVVEPDLAWFRAALDARDLTAIFSSGRVTLLLDAPVGLINTVLGETAQVHVVRMRSLAAKDVNYFRAVDEELRSVTARKDINKNTLARFGKRWVRNLIRNLHLIPRSRGVHELEGNFDGIPCIVLAAGPSLDEIIPHLVELRERFLLIAVDTSYRAVIDAGVIPDFLVVVDPQYWNARHLDGCPLESTILVSESSTYPSVFHRPVGELFFCGSLFPLGQYLEQKLGERGKLGAGGSVSTTTWDFARTLGCTPIFCAGLDLGFPSLKTHFRGGFFEERAHAFAERTNSAETMAFHSLRDAAPYPVANNSGEVTLTDKRLVVYKWWFETQLKMHAEAATFNLASRGVRINDMPLERIEVLLRYPPLRDEINPRLAAIRKPRPTDTPSMQSRRSLRAAIEELVAELRTLEAVAETGILTVAELETALTSGNDPAPAIEKLDRLDQTIGRQSTRDIAGFLMHSTAQAILDRESSDQGGIEDGIERQRALEDSRELYTKLSEAARYHIGLLNTAAARLGPGD